MNKFSMLKGLAGILSLSILASLSPVQAQSADTVLIDQYAQGLGASSVGQVSSVSELSDVDPNSWAFQALKSLVERYGCIEGYPSKVFLGNKSTSRYEFAAGLNACMDKVNELIAAGVADKATKDDLATLQRLQEEFSAELATLRGRVDALQAKVREIESQMFSTTTKLDGSVVMAVQGGGGNGGRFETFRDACRLGFGAPNCVSSGSANTTFVARTTLNLRSTFTGKDELLIRLRGVSGQDIANTFQGINGGLGTLFYAASPTGAYDGSASATQPTNGLANVTFDKVRYTTTLFSDKFRVFVGPRIDIFEYIDTNSFANNEEVDFSSGFFINNPLTTFTFAGPGAGFDWEIGKSFSLRGIYIAPAGGQSQAFGSGGLTGNGTALTFETEFRSGTAKLKLQYTGNTGGNYAGTTLGGSTYGGLNAEWAVTKSFGVFGRYNFGTTYDFGTLGLGGSREFSSTSWAVGANIGDLFAPGAVLGAAVGQAPRVRGPFPTRGFGIVDPSGSEFNVEIFYKFPLNDRITLTPDVQIISNGNNVSNNPVITVGTLRAVFTF